MVAFVATAHFPSMMMLDVLGYHCLPFFPKANVTL